MSVPMQLDPCPFCGSDDVQLVHRLAYFVECARCFAEGPWKQRYHTGADHGDVQTEIAAVNAWNNRPVHS
jgi:Lar family restriction alleviation protein